MVEIYVPKKPHFFHFFPDPLYVQRFPVRLISLSASIRIECTSVQKLQTEFSITFSPTKPETLPVSSLCCIILFVRPIPYKKDTFEYCQATHDHENDSYGKEVIESEEIFEELDVSDDDDIMQSWEDLARQLPMPLA